MVIQDDCLDNEQYYSPIWKKENLKLSQNSQNAAAFHDYVSVSTISANFS